MASYQSGQLSARPHSSHHFGSFASGLRKMGLEAKRDGFLYVPPSLSADRPCPLFVTLHGAGGSAHHALDPFRDLADHTGTLLLAPESQGRTWDVILGGFGTDVHWINEALEDVFSLYSVDPNRLAVGGFSDGASYALSLGLTNGHLFSHILSFSPGFAAPSKVDGSPRIFISHGTLDKVLPINYCSRKLVPIFKDSGLEVNYQEFNGGHTIPTEIGQKAFKWFLGEEADEEIRESVVPSQEAGISST